MEPSRVQEPFHSLHFCLLEKCFQHSRPSLSSKGQIQLLIGVRKCRIKERQPINNSAAMDQGPCSLSRNRLMHNNLVHISESFYRNQGPHIGRGLQTGWDQKAEHHPITSPPTNQRKVKYPAAHHPHPNFAY